MPPGRAEGGVPKASGSAHCVRECAGPLVRCSRQDRQDRPQNELPAVTGHHPPALRSKAWPALSALE